VRAITWRGVNETAVETLDDPRILNARDIILEVGLTATCGSDLHLLGGYIPAMRAGDVLGHEFMGTVAEVGPEVRNHKVGDRVVVCSFISCGQCWYCRNELWSLCDNGNPNRPSPRGYGAPASAAATATPTPSAASPAATPTTSASPSPTRAPSPSRTRSRT